MHRRLGSVSLLCGLLILLAQLPSASLARTSTALQPPVAAPLATAPAASPYLPLPDQCAGLLSAVEGAAPRCISGYVYVDGQPIDSARVTITGPQGSLERWTQQLPAQRWPYYRAALSVDPLLVEAGQTITLTASYSGHTRTITHTVLEGSQQVDIVLPQAQPVDYVFMEPIHGRSDLSHFDYPWALAVNGTGTVYVADMHQIKVYNAEGQGLFRWGMLGTEPGQFSSPRGIAVDAHGDVYVADTGNFRVQRFSATGEWLGGWGGPTPWSGGFFFMPEGIALDGLGHLYVVDGWHHRLLKYSVEGELLAVWGGYGTVDGTFYGPNGVAVDSQGNVYVSQEMASRIQKFTSGGQWLKTWSVPTAAFGLTIDRDDNLYVTIGRSSSQGEDNHLLQKYSLDGVLLQEWGTYGRYGRDDGEFTNPSAIGADSQGNIYVADSGNQRVQKFSGAGAWLQSWGWQGLAVGTRVFSRKFYSPEDVGVDSLGNIYIADTGNLRVEKYLPDQTWAGAWGSEQQNGPGFSLYLPSEIGVGPPDRVYVAGGRADDFHQFDAAGRLLKIWNENTLDLYFESHVVAVDSTGYVYHTEASPAHIYKFNSAGELLVDFRPVDLHPGRLAVDGAGNMYVASDGAVHKLRPDFTPDPGWQIPAGEGGRGGNPMEADAAGNLYLTRGTYLYKFSSTGAPLGRWGGPGHSRDTFGQAAGLAVNAQGTIYIADKGHERVQVLRPVTYSRPLATIVAATPRQVERGQPVALHGMGSDSDMTPEVAAHLWTLDGAAVPFASGTSVTLATDGLAAGRHEIALTVVDTEGERSDPQVLEIEVAEPAQPSESWTFLLYLDADMTFGGLANYLSRSSLEGALYRLEHASASAVPVVVLYDGPGSADSVRYQFLPGGQLVEEPVAEVNMGDPQTLVDFVRWGRQVAPADRYYLSLANHGNALDGIAWDTTSGNRERITGDELTQALAALTDNGALPLDVLHLDAPLMGLVEVAYQVRGMARYLIASENTIWNIYGYDSYRAAVGAATSPAALATAVVARYAALVEASASDATPLPYTIAALDMSRVDAVASALDLLAVTLSERVLADELYASALLELRAQTQLLDSDGNRVFNQSDEYVDLYDWADRLQSSSTDVEVQAAAQALLAALDQLLLAEAHVSGAYAGLALSLDGVHGLGIYYPALPSKRTYQTYLTGGLTFPVETRWDEFLAVTLPGDDYNPAEALLGAFPVGAFNLAAPRESARLLVPLVGR